MWFSELALAVCEHDGIEQRFHHLDTTSFALSGNYIPESDTQAIHITHGYSKDHRPDLKQAVLELLVSQDGGVPMVSKSWDGNTSDSQIFKERAEALIATFASAQAPRYLVADAKLYSEDHATSLTKLGFITRIPATLKLVSQVIDQALTWDLWQRLDETTRYHRLELCHYGMPQRWFVVWSQAAMERAEKSVNKAQQRELEAINKQLFHLQAKRFETREAAHAALAALATSWHSHHVHHTDLIDHTRYACQGRPTPSSRIKSIAWQIHAQVCVDQERMTTRKQHGACYVIGSNIPASHVSDVAVTQAYKSQAQAEGGFRFLKDPLFFVSSLFVKKPSRIQGLLMVMTLALLMYAVTQRRLRRQLACQNETIPNQINQPTQQPTLRWVFQLLDGIHRVQITVQDQVQDLIEGLNDIQVKILRLFGAEVCHLYQISPG